MAVKFTRSHTVGALYNKGEVAKFDPEVEADLIERKIAEAVEAKGKGRQKAPKPTLTSKKAEDGSFVVLNGAVEVRGGFADEAAAQAFIDEQG